MERQVNRDVGAVWAFACLQSPPIAFAPTSGCRVQLCWWSACPVPRSAPVVREGKSAFTLPIRFLEDATT
jgi:hypothetical protein